MAVQSIPEKITFIGAGNMAGALIGGMLQNSFSANQIIAADPYQPSLDRLANDYQIAIASNNAEAVALADVVVLAVKPQVMQEALQQCRAVLYERRPLLISIAAGIPVASMQAWLGAAMPIVRCMPNTPALLGLGATGLFANEQVSDAQREQSERILGAVGITAWVNEEALLDAVTAVSGSGPAYFFAIMESMQEIAQSMGLDSELAQRFVQQTALGAARMAQDSDVDVAELRRRVSSPGGTTLAALHQLEQGGLQTVLQSALQAAQLRAREMAQELSSDEKES